MDIINAQIEVLKEALKGKSKRRCLYEDRNIKGLVLVTKFQGGDEQ